MDHLTALRSSDFWFSHAMISDSIQPTARAPNGIGFGKEFFWMKEYIDERDNAVIFITSGSFRILSVIFGSICCS